MSTRLQQGWIRSPGADLLAATLLLVALALAVRALGPNGTSQIKQGTLMEVDHVHDGDSLWLEHEGEVHYFRLLGVDAPEVQLSARLREQAKQLDVPPEILRSHGEAAKRWLASRTRAADKVTVYFDRRQKDKYGRYLAHIFVPGQSPSLSEELLQSGLAFRYRDRVNRRFQREYDLAYREAREKRKGIWALSPGSRNQKTKGNSRKN